MIDAMNLYLLRHGVAVARGSPGYAKDADRPLASKGERKVRRIAKAMQSLDLGFHLILSSPYCRARETAEIVARAMGLRKRLEYTESLTPEGTAKELIAFLSGHREKAENVLLVGHEPYMSELISLLLAGDSGFSMTLKKGGLCKLRLGALRHGRCACLEWLLTPRQMERIAG